MKRLLALSALVLLVVPDTARAGRIHHRDVGLEEAVAMAHVAVIVELDAGAPQGMRPVKIPVAGEGDKTCPPYEYGVWTGRVVERLGPAAGGDGLPQVGERIVVFPGNTPELVQLSRRACLEGGSKSPIFSRMAGGAEPAGGAKRIVLLRWEAPFGWLESLGGAWLATDGRAAVERALAKTTSPLLAPATDDGGRPVLEEVYCESAADCVWAVPGCRSCPPCWNTPRGAVHRGALARMLPACRAWRKERGVRCAPCRRAIPGASPDPVPVCRDMRCDAPIAK